MGTNQTEKRSSESLQHSDVGKLRTCYVESGKSIVGPTTVSNPGEKLHKIVVEHQLSFWQCGVFGDIDYNYHIGGIDWRPHWNMFRR